jgi:hypothetical protein
MNQEEALYMIPSPYDPLSPTLSLRERGLVGRMADQSGFQP